MSIFKCKMCGGDLEIIEGKSVAECQYCGTLQTLPKLDDDKKSNMFDRANHFRRSNEYDKAMSIYEKLLEEDSTDAETYWSIVLCRYGIEYVEDPATHKRVPTVNRAQFTSVVSDKDYKSALKYGTPEQKELYKKEAREIDKIQKGILAISQKEEPFDVFICYKETDANGRRTPDSVLANDLYHQLVQEGFKVFFSRITLEDKLGTAYEPYIFAALHSAKVMVVLGTKPEYFNAVWVKNEWSRYLALVNTSGGKKMLIPAYKDMDPYDLPEEFSHLQAQDMSKLGFMQDLIRGIKKIVSVQAPDTVAKTASVISSPVAAGTNTAPLLKRAFMFLEDEEWDRADDFCEQVLNLDPENAQAYLGKMMAELHVRKQDELADLPEPFYSKSNFQKFVRFGDEANVERIKSYNKQIAARNEDNRKANIYKDALNTMKNANDKNKYLSAAEAFKSISGYKDSDNQAEICISKAEELIQISIAKEEADRLESERKSEQLRIKKEKKVKIVKITLASISLLIVIIICLNTIITSAKRSKAVSLGMGYAQVLGKVEELDLKSKWNKIGYEDEEVYCLDIGNVEVSKLFKLNKIKEFEYDISNITLKFDGSLNLIKVDFIANNTITVSHDKKALKKIAQTFTFDKVKGDYDWRSNTSDVSSTTIDHFEYDFSDYSIEILTYNSKLSSLLLKTKQ